MQRETRYSKEKDNIRKNNAELKADVLTHYSNHPNGICACCFITGIIFLTIDHIDGNGNEHRRTLGLKGGTAFYRYLKSNNYPNNPPLQVLCYNCNNAKRINDGYCPHLDETNRFAQWT